MKIAFAGLEIVPGKVKYKDDRLTALVEKFSPDKITPFFVEFVKEDFLSAGSIAILKDKVLDLLILDIEKIESRLSRASEEGQKALLEKCLAYLEKEVPLCDGDFSIEEKQVLKELAPLSFKPVFLAEDKNPDADILVKKVLAKSKIVFFYTAGKKEVRAWPVKEGLDIVSCAGKIHSDLARGFIKADIVNFQEFRDLHNMNEAKAKGLVNTVDREYTIKDGDIIEIRFNV